MAKTTVATITSEIKQLADYNITDTGLDALILIGINNATKRMKQWFMDQGMYDEIGASDTLTTVADQEYIDLASETVDFDASVIITERTNDTPITLISYSEYKQRVPDPDADKAAVPDFAAFYGNRIYFAPTPSGAISIYLDYVKLISKLTSSDSLPFEEKYDELVQAMCVEMLVKWLNRADTAGVAVAKKDVQDLKHEMIVSAVKHIGQNKQSQSRRQTIPYFAPKKVIN